MKSNRMRRIASYDMTIQADQPATADDLYISLRDIAALAAEAPWSRSGEFHHLGDILRWCASMAGESPIFNWLWRDAEQDGWHIAFTELNPGAFTLSPADHILWLDNGLADVETVDASLASRVNLIFALSRALREIGHERAVHRCPPDAHPEDMLMLERVRAADCDTVALLILWELRGAGHYDIWRQVIGSDIGDMATVFTRSLERDPAALFDRAALAFAFRQWFADNARVDMVDHETLEALDEIIGADYSAGPKGRSINGPAIEAMGELPDGTCYLHGLGDHIRHDPFFAGLGDPINQSHLFQLVYDSQVVMVNNVPFRDIRLARRIFPDSF